MRGEPPAIALVGRAIDIAIVVGGMVLAALIFGNVLSRYLLDFDVAWSTELAVFLLVWTTFLGAAAASRRRAHLQVIEFVDMIEGRTRRLIEVAIQLVVALVLVLLVWYGGVIAWANMEQDMTVLYWPVGTLYLAMPVGCALMLLFCIVDLVGAVRGTRSAAASPQR